MLRRQLKQTCSCCIPWASSHARAIQEPITHRLYMHQTSSTVHRCELSRMFGIDFMSVISRWPPHPQPQIARLSSNSNTRAGAASSGWSRSCGAWLQAKTSCCWPPASSRSPYIFCKKTKTPNVQQVAGQRAMEALPLVMEPESRM
jgi:hypothetical protein